MVAKWYVFSVIFEVMSRVRIKPNKLDGMKCK